MDTPRANAPADDKAAALSVSSSSLIGPNDGQAKPSSAGILSDLVIAIDNAKFMTLQPQHLVFQIEQKSKDRSTVCGIPVGSPVTLPTTTVPLYNVLWAERKDNLLEVTYAEPAGTHKLKPTTVSVDVSVNEEAVLDAFIDALMSRSYGPAKRQKRAKILVNPHAGPGGSEAKYKHDAEPLFRAARMVLDVQKTTRTKEAIDIARDIDIDAFDTIVACSGDGVPHEIFNGLAARPDARRALRKIAVAQIPCGSGNALACSLFGTPYVSDAALGIIKGIDTPLDLATLTQGNERIVSFLSQAVGLMADADLGTEHLRWMGGLRFEVGVLMRLVKKMRYPCDLHLKVESDDKAAIKAAYKEYKQRPRAVEPANSQNGGDDGDSGLPQLKYGTVNDPVPEDWQKIKSDNMLTFYCGTMPAMAHEIFFFSAALPDDGLLDLVTIDSPVPLLTGVDMVANCMGDGGKFFDHSYVTYRKVSAFRLTPRDQEHGFISIDGEKVPFAPFQVEVMPKAGTVLAPTKGFICKGPKGWEDA